MRKPKEEISMAPMRFNHVPEDVVDAMCKDYEEKRAKYLLDERARWPKTNFSPFDIGFNCNAYHYFSIKHWEQKPEPDPDLLEIFKEGVLHEPSIIEKLKTAGFEVSAFNVPFSIVWGKNMPVKGKIDLCVKYNGYQIPVEAKSMAPHAYDSIKTWEDFLKSKSAFHKCYPYQLNTYLYVCKMNFGIFALKNKVNGRVKLIKMPFSESMMQEVMERVVIVSNIIQKNKGDLEQMKCKDSTWCNRCDFRIQCLGDDCEKIVPLIEDSELEEILLRREKIKAFFSEYNKLDKSAKAALKDKPEAVIGDFYITGKSQSRKGYEVKDTTFWVTDIIYRGANMNPRSENVDD